MQARHSAGQQLIALAKYFAESFCKLVLGAAD
jgi:hypothetical protein